MRAGGIDSNGASGRAFAALAAAAAAFAIYGSLIPFEFRAAGAEEVLSRIAAARFEPPGSSAHDLVENVLLALPLGLGLAGALARRTGRAGAVALATALCALFAVAVEVAQVFVPARDPSPNDIAAQTAGGALGAVVFLVLGPALVGWIEERRRPAAASRLLLAYGVLFTLTQLAPFDVTLDPGQLAEKWDAGRIVPGLRADGPALGLLREALGDLAIAAPLGALAVLGPRRRGRASPGLAALAAVAGVLAIEVAQVFVLSREAAARDALAKAAGVVLGAALAAAIDRRPVATDEPPVRAGWAAAAFAYALVLSVSQWAPFAFSFERERLAERGRSLAAVPFASLALGDPAAALHHAQNLGVKALLALPLGVLLGLAVPRAATRGRDRLRVAVLLGLAGGLLVLLEAGQVALAARSPDSTDPVVGLLGVAVGVGLTRVLAGPAEPVDGAAARGENGRSVEVAGDRA